MTNLWLWNCVHNPWNFRETILFILLGNKASSLKFEFICLVRLGLFYSQWNLIRMHFFVAWLQRDCNYHDEIQKRIALHEFQSSWRFLKFSEALHVYPNRFYVRNQVSQKVKGEILNWDAIANPRRAIQVQAMFSAKKKTLTGDTDDQKFNCDNADGHSQAGNVWFQKISRPPPRRELEIPGGVGGSEAQEIPEGTGVGP